MKMMAYSQSKSVANMVRSRCFNKVLHSLPIHDSIFCRVFATFSVCYNEIHLWAAYDHRQPKFSEAQRKFLSVGWKRDNLRILYRVKPLSFKTSCVQIGSTVAACGGPHARCCFVLRTG